MCVRACVTLGINVFAKKFLFEKKNVMLTEFNKIYIFTQQNDLTLNVSGREIQFVEIHVFRKACV